MRKIGTEKKGRKQPQDTINERRENGRLGEKGREKKGKSITRENKRREKKRKMRERKGKK